MNNCTTADKDATIALQQKNGVFYAVRAEMLWAGQISELVGKW
jgi:hypothetical protein